MVGGDASIQDNVGNASAPAQLFRNLRPMDSSRHQALGFRNRRDFSFVGGVTVLPLTLTEFAPAARCYPIVFSQGDRPQPLAVMGIPGGDNLFIDEAGRWDDGVYLPGYLQCYPFALTPLEGQKFALSVDEESPWLSTGSDHPLFDKGQPTKLLQEAAKSCQAYANHAHATQPFGEALVKAGLLVDRGLTFSGQRLDKPIQIGVRVVDETKLHDLADETYLSFRKQRWDGAVHLHLASQIGWQGLISRQMRRQAAAELMGKSVI